MNYVSLIVFTLLLAATHSSCKKGDNDPFFSLRTRRARLAGDWKLTSAETAEFTQNSQYSLTFNSTFDGLLETWTQTQVYANGNTYTNSDTLQYTHFITLRKDGTFRQTYWEEGLGTTVTEGTWIFLRKSNEKALKNKEAVLLNITLTDNNGTVTTDTDLFGIVYAIDRLKNNEMTWIRVYGHDSGTVQHSYLRKMTFTPGKP